MKTSGAKERLIGRRFRRMAVEYRVMAQADGYVMMRAKGCVPFVEYIKDLKRDYYETTPTTPARP